MDKRTLFGFLRSPTSSNCPRDSQVFLALRWSRIALSFHSLNFYPIGLRLCLCISRSKRAAPSRIPVAFIAVRVPAPYLNPEEDGTSQGLEFTSESMLASAAGSCLVSIATPAYVCFSLLSLYRNLIFQSVSSFSLAHSASTKHVYPGSDATRMQTDALVSMLASFQWGVTCVFSSSLLSPLFFQFFPLLKAQED